MIILFSQVCSFGNVLRVLLFWQTVDAISLDLLSCGSTNILACSERPPPLTMPVSAQKVYGNPSLRSPSEEWGY